MKALKQLLARTPKGELFHYTTQSGLLGIISANELWATHVRYLNDASEFTHAVYLASSMATQMLQKETDAKRRVLIQDLIHGINQAGINICVASFSENGNLLSQWRTYSRGGTGYSLGFVFQDIRDAIQQHDERWILAPCVYKEEEQKQLLAAILEETLQENLNNKNYDEHRRHLPGGNIMYYMNRYSAIFKDKYFEEEQEWRLISPPLDCSDKRFAYREGKSTIIPYYRLPLKASQDGSGPKLHQIYVGSSPHPDLAKIAVESFLASKSYEMAEPEVEVTISLIPYRANW